MAALTKTLTDAGGWTVTVALLVIFSWLWVSGKVVPGWLYTKEVEGRAKATDIAEKAVDGVTSLTTQQEALSKLLEGFIAGSHRRGS